MGHRGDVERGLLDVGGKRHPCLSSGLLQRRHTMLTPAYGGRAGGRQPLSCTSDTCLSPQGSCRSSRAGTSLSSPFARGGAPLTDGGGPLSVPLFQLLCGLSLPNNTKATRALLAQQGSAGQVKISLIHQALFDV